MLEFGNLKMPYLNSGDAPDIGGQALAQAQRLDLVSGAGVALVDDSPARAALVTDGDAFDGLLVEQLDTHALYQRIGSAWVLLMRPTADYTPTISNFTSASTAATKTGRWSASAGRGDVAVRAKLGTGTITVGDVTVTTPFTMDTTGMVAESTVLGTALFRDVSSGDRFHGQVVFVDSTTVRLLRPVAGTVGAMNVLASTNPFTWATLDELSAQFSAPIA